MGITVRPHRVSKIRVVSIPFRGFHGDNEEDIWPSYDEYVSIPFRGFHGDNVERNLHARTVHVSIPFRGFHGDNAVRAHAELVTWGFNPLSGIPWG